MKLFFAQVATAIAVGAGLFFAAAPVQAQGYDGYHSRSESRYERDDYRDPPPSYRERGGYGYNHYKPRHRPRPSDGCLATIRATGVGNIFPGVARLNATLAWKREVQAVYGFRGNWSSAKAKSIECNGTRCTAKGRPCRY